MDMGMQKSDPHPHPHGTHIHDPCGYAIPMQLPTCTGCPAWRQVITQQSCKSGARFANTELGQTSMCHDSYFVSSLLLYFTSFTFITLLHCSITFYVYPKVICSLQVNLGVISHNIILRLFSITELFTP